MKFLLMIFLSATDFQVVPMESIYTCIAAKNAIELKLYGKQSTLYPQIYCEELVVNQ